MILHLLLPYYTTYSALHLLLLRLLVLLHLLLHLEVLSYSFTTCCTFSPVPPLLLQHFLLKEVVW